MQLKTLLEIEIEEQNSKSKGISSVGSCVEDWCSILASMIFHYPAGQTKMELLFTYAPPFHSRGLELGCIRVRVRVGLGFGLVLELELGLRLVEAYANGKNIFQHPDKALKIVAYENVTLV